MTDYSLYLVADRATAGTRSLDRIVGNAIAGGATIVQLRAKEANTREVTALAERLHRITKRAGIPLIVNDRVDVALAIGAEGVHVGQDDMPVQRARKIIGPKKILGVSVKTTSQARRAEKDGADYVGVGDIFGTRSKADAGKPVGLEALARIARAVRIPVVGIGAISAQNAASVIEAGASGVAVISAIVGARKPRAAAARLKAVITNALIKRNRYE